MLPCDAKIRFGVQLASGLCFLHSHGILHHDIKTDNALLDANHSVCKLADFGLASLSLSKGKYTVTVGGTLRYLAPEKVEDAYRQAREMRDRGDARGVSSSSSISLGRTLVSLEDRADVYAFGLLLWELIHERRAFEGMSAHEAAMSARKGIRPERSKPSKGDGIQTLTAECWAQCPEDRPSMSTVLERLETCMQDLSATQSVTRTESSLQQSTPTGSNYMMGSPMETTVIPLRSMLHGTGAR
jgi:serine/threonine protein kinase